MHERAVQLNKCQCLKLIIIHHGRQVTVLEANSYLGVRKPLCSNLLKYITLNYEESEYFKSERKHRIYNKY